MNNKAKFLFCSFLLIGSSFINAMQSHGEQQYCGIRGINEKGRQLVRHGFLMEREIAEISPVIQAMFNDGFAEKGGDGDFSNIQHKTLILLFDYLKSFLVKIEGQEFLQDSESFLRKKYGFKKGGRFVVKLFAKMSESGFEMVDDDEIQVVNQIKDYLQEIIGGDLRENRVLLFDLVELFKATDYLQLTWFKQAIKRVLFSIIGDESLILYALKNELDEDFVYILLNDFDLVKDALIKVFQVEDVRSHLSLIRFLVNSSIDMRVELLDLFVKFLNHSDVQIAFELLFKTDIFDINDGIFRERVLVRFLNNPDFYFIPTKDETILRNVLGDIEKRLADEDFEFPSKKVSQIILFLESVRWELWSLNNPFLFAERNGFERLACLLGGEERFVVPAVKIALSNLGVDAFNRLVACVNHSASFFDSFEQESREWVLSRHLMKIENVIENGNYESIDLILREASKSGINPYGHRHNEDIDGEVESCDYCKISRALFVVAIANGSNQLIKEAVDATGISAVDLFAVCVRSNSKELVSCIANAFAIGNLESIKLISKFNGEINVVDLIKSNQKKFAEVLKRKADIGIASVFANYGHSSPWSSVVRGDLRGCSLSCNEIELINLVIDNNKSAFVQVIEKFILNGNVTVVRALFATNARKLVDVDSKVSDITLIPQRGWRGGAIDHIVEATGTPLYIAARIGSLPLVRFFVEELGAACSVLGKERERSVDSYLVLTRLGGFSEGILFSLQKCQAALSEFRSTWNWTGSVFDRQKRAEANFESEQASLLDRLPVFKRRRLESIIRSNNLTPIEIARLRGHGRVVAYLEQHHDVDSAMLERIDKRAFVGTCVLDRIISDKMKVSFCSYNLFEVDELVIIRSPRNAEYVYGIITSELDRKNDSYEIKWQTDRWLSKNPVAVKKYEIGKLRISLEDLVRLNLK